MVDGTQTCYNCGAKVPISAKFCTKCGADLRMKEQSYSQNVDQDKQGNSDALKLKKDERAAISRPLSQKTHRILMRIGSIFLAAALLCLAFNAKNTNDLINKSFASTTRQWVNQTHSVWPILVVLVGSFVAVAILSFACFNRRDARFTFVSFLFSITAVTLMGFANQELTTNRLYEAVQTLATDRLSGSKQLFTFSYDHYLSNFDETDTAYSCGVYTFEKDGTLLVNAESIASNQKQTPQDAAEVYKKNEGLSTEGAADDKGTWRVSKGVLFLNYGHYNIVAAITIPYVLDGSGGFGLNTMTPKIAGHKFDAMQLSCAGYDFKTSANPDGKLSITDDEGTYDLKGDAHHQGAREFTLYWPQPLVK